LCGNDKLEGLLTANTSKHRIEAHFGYFGTSGIWFGVVSTVIQYELVRIKKKIPKSIFPV